MRTTRVALILVAFFGCGNDGKDKGGSDANNPPGPDATQFLDAPPTMTAQVTVSGQATERTAQGSGPVQGVLIEAFRNSNETTPIAMTTTDAQGMYSITVDTNGESLDGFLKASKSGFVTTYLYPPYPLMMDFANASVIMITSGTYDALCNLGQAMCAHGDGQGLIGLIVTDGTNPVGGATVSSNPLADPIVYNAMVGTLVLPSPSAMSTYTDGVAYLFNLAPGQVTVSATHPTMTLASHGAKTWANDLTTTVIVPP
jgi:hypothetical protein